MAIQVEMWKPQIIEEFYKSNRFLQFLHNADEYVVGGRIVHIPNAGDPAEVKRNRTQLPAPVVKRADVDITYALDEFTSNPTHISNAEMVELSYDKMGSVIRENTAKIRETAAEWMLYHLSKNTASGSKLPSTGASASATAPGATGNRKIYDEADIRKARKLLNQQSVPQENRYMLLSSEALDQLMSDNDLKYAFQQVVDLEEGVIGRLYGFNLLERSSVLTVDNSQAIKNPDAATATSDSEAVLFWQQDSLERAMGEVNMYDNYGRAEYYGDIFSFLVRCGGRARRNDGKGYGIIYRDSV